MTLESIQAMIDQALLRNSTNGDGSHSSHGDNRRNVQTARPCFYADFMKCQPLNFKGTEGVVGLTRWIEKMESVFNISGCAIENQVKFATCTLLGAALTWWNGQIRTLGPEAYAMTWEVLKKKMTDKYCPQGEIKKLEIELWNLKVKGNDVPAYTERFQELTLICTKFVANETEKVDKYISGLPDNIYGNVKSARPKTLDETIELANDLMDQKLRTYAERQSDLKLENNLSHRSALGMERDCQHGLYKAGGVSRVDDGVLQGRSMGAKQGAGWFWYWREVWEKGVKPSTSASRSQPSSNTKKDKIQQTQRTAHVQHSKLNVNPELKCVKCNGCMLSDNHDLYVLDFINNVNARKKSKYVKKSSKRKFWKPTGKVFTNIGYLWRPTGRTFTIVGNACPLTRIITTAEVPLRKPTALDNETPKLVLTLVYSRKRRKSQTKVPVSKSKVIQIVLWYLDSGCSKHMTGDSSQLTNFVNKFLGIVKFENDHMAKIMGYGDSHIGNVTILRVYYVEGLRHNLFSVGQLCDSNLQVAFRQHTCFIRNLEGVDLLNGSRRNNLYTLSLGDMMASSPICRYGLVRGLPKLKFEKDHLCSACAMGKSKKNLTNLNLKTPIKKNFICMDHCGPMRVASVNGKKYILVVVDDYSRFTWVKCLRSKDKAPDFIIKFFKMIQVRLKVPV
ncbi:retrovirus-related pol polyprotein from transposon TNT 1-94 [Tanacetum coccineum]